MGEILKLLLEMDPSVISDYINYFFIALGVIAIIGFLVGFIKGVYKESTTFLVTGIYFVILVSINKWISEAIYRLDVSSLLTIPNEGKTIGDFLNYYFVDLCSTYGITIGNSQQMLNMIVSLSLAFINLVVYLVLLLAGTVIVGLVSFLIYFLIVRLIVPKKVRKKKKARVAGGLFGLVRYVVAFSLLLSPFSAMVNSVVGNLRDEDGNIVRTEIDNDFYNAMMNVLEGYNNSKVAQMFFTVQDIDGRSFDVALMDYITESQLDNGKVISLYTEIGNFGSVAVNAVSTGFIESTNTINLGLLLGADFVGGTIETIAKSTLIQTLLSVGVTLAVNMDSVKQSIDLSSVDFMNMDWENTLTAVSSAYTELYNCGLIEEVISSPEEFLNDFYLDSSYSTSIKSAFRTLGDNNLISQIMPPLIVSFLSSMKTETKGLKKSNNFEISDKLLDQKTYQDIKWGTELASIYEVFEDLSKQYFAYENKHLTISSLNELSSDTILNILFGTGIDFSSEEDTSYSEEYERNVFVKGGEYVNNNISHDVPGTKQILGINEYSTLGLFNLQIIDTMFEEKIFNDFINLLDINSLLQMEEDDIDLNEKVLSIVTKWEKQDWTNELASLIDVVAPVMKLVDILSNENGSLKEAKRASQEGGMELATILGDDTLMCLRRVTDVLADSKIFNVILPDILESYTDKSEDELLAGLSVSDLNFTYFESSTDSLIGELRSFIEDVDTINEELIDLLEKLETKDAIDALIDDCSNIDNSVFGTLLKMLEKNQIFNKALTEEEKENNEHRTFTKVMANLLAETNDSNNQMNLYNMTDGKVIIDSQTIYNFENSESGWSDEIDALLSFIGCLKTESGEEQVIYDYITGNTGKNFDFTNEIFNCGNEIERIFSHIDDSEILKDAFPNTINNLIGDSFTEFLGCTPDFNSVVSWEEEGHYFNLLLENINSLRNGQDVSTIDWLTVDAALYSENAFNNRPDAFKQQYNYSYAEYFLENSRINELLNSLYRAQCIGGSYDELDSSRDGGVFHSMLKSILSTSLESLGIEIEGENVPESDIIDKDFNIDSNEKVIYKVDGITLVYVSWEENLEHGYIGEIGNISIMINYVNGLSDDATVGDMEEILKRINSCYILRNTLPLIIESKTDSFRNGEDELMKEFVERSDFEVFHKDELSLTPYDKIDDVVIENEKSKTLQTRQEEIETRNEEISSIVDILNEAETITDNIGKDSEGDDQFASIKSILENDTVLSTSSNATSSVERILNKMHDSKIFHAVDTFTVDEERTSLTAFEYFFQYVLTNESLQHEENGCLFNSPSDEFIYQITSEDGWINKDGTNGEISNFNNGLYTFVDNPLIDVVLNAEGDFLDSVNDVLVDEHGNNLSPIQDMLMSMHNSLVLDLSTGKIMDDYILDNILNALDYENSIYSTDINVYSERISNILETSDYEDVKEIMVSFGYTAEYLEDLTEENVMEYVWKNEGKVVEDLIRSLDDFKFDNFEMGDITSSFIDDLSSSMMNSFGLNYLDILDEDYENNYRSSYQLLIIKITDTAIDAIENSLAIDEVDRTTSSNMITSYEHEREVILNLVDEYNNVKEVLEKDSLKGDNAFNVSKYSEYQQDDLDAIDGLIQVLKSSYVYNYERNTLTERNIYERVIMKLVDSVKTGFESSGIVSEEESKYTTSYDIPDGKFEDEKQITFNIARRYKDVENLLDSGSIVDDLNDASREHIKNLVLELQGSEVFNYAEMSTGYKETDNSDNSYYQHIILYMISKINDSLEDSLELDVEEASKDKIISYETELDVVLDIMQAYQKVSSNFENSNNIDFDNMSKSEKDKFMDNITSILKPLYDSNVYHYVKNGNRAIKVTNLSNLSIFEQMIYTLLNSSENILENLYVENDNGIDYSETITNDQDALNLRIRDVTSSDLLEDGELHWWDELDTVGEITKIHDVTGEDITTQLDVTNKLDLKGIVKDIYVTNSEDKLLNKINNSYILHDIVPNIVSRYITTHDAENSKEVEENNQTISVDDLIFLKGSSYSDVRGYCGDKVDSYKIENNVEYTFAQKVEKWNKDLYHVAQLIDLFRELKEAGSDIANVDGNFFENILTNLSETETYHDAVPQILISILNDKLSVDVNGFKLAIGTFISGSNSYEKLVTFFYEVDNFGGYEDMIDELDYSSMIYTLEGQGLDYLISWFKTKDLTDTRTDNYALAAHIKSNFLGTVEL